MLYFGVKNLQPLQMGEIFLYPLKRAPFVFLWIFHSIIEIGSYPKNKNINNEEENFQLSTFWNYQENMIDPTFHMPIE